MILKAQTVVYTVNPLSFFKGPLKGNSKCGKMDICRKSFKCITNTRKQQQIKIFIFFPTVILLWKHVQ